MAAIDIGTAATDRSAGHSISTNPIVEENPANAAGTITSVEIWVGGASISNVEVATFEEVATDTFTTRDSETLGTVTGGSKQTFSGLDMDVQTGDYIGTHGDSGDLEADWSGSYGMWYDPSSGDYIPCANQALTHYSPVTLSLYGEGEMPPTEKSSSDTGSGVDAYVSLETPEAKASSDTGSGVDAKASGNPVATLVKAETGSGSDVLSQVQAILDGAETGSGVDAVDSLETPEAKTSSDAGSGVEGTPAQSAILAGSETGAGIEALTSRLLAGGETGGGAEGLIARLLAALDTGSGAEASSLETEGSLEALFASELGEGSDRLTAKIEMPIKGGGMKLWT